MTGKHRIFTGKRSEYMHLTWPEETEERHMKVQVNGKTVPGISIDGADGGPDAIARIGSIPEVAAAVGALPVVRAVKVEGVMVNLITAPKAAA